MEIGGRTVTSKENQEAKGKVAANVAAEPDCGGRDQSGSENGGGTAEMKAGLDVMYSYDIRDIRKRNLQDTYAKQSSILRTTRRRRRHVSIIVSLHSQALERS
jgi:hypothetical protein